MAKNTLSNKVWDKHAVGELPTGQTQLYIGMHLLHEVTSPQAFQMLRERKLRVARPDLTKCIVDHVIPTCDASRPFKDPQAELMTKTLEDNAKEFGIEYFGPDTGKQGVCHVSYPEQGLILPGKTVVCGDSHTCTHGAFGALAFGIGTTQVSHVLATQTMAMDPLKVRKIEFNGAMPDGVTAKDLVLHMIAELGVKGGLGFAYEIGGDVVDGMSMEERMTICNMAVEGGARSGYMNPDQTTIDYLNGRTFAPKEDFDKAAEAWLKLASGPDAEYDDVVKFEVDQLSPYVTWGTNPAQGAMLGDNIPYLGNMSDKEAEESADALEYMGLKEGQELLGIPVDVAFIGSCTNGRLSDLVQAAEVMEGNKVKIPTLVVPGSEQVRYEAEVMGLDEVFKEAGAEWRLPGCSMCLAMNPDKLVGDQRSISTSNRNFKGRQGSPTGRTHLASPYVAAASAIEGRITDPLPYIGGGLE